MSLAIDQSPRAPVNPSGETPRRLLSGVVRTPHGLQGPILFPGSEGPLVPLVETENLDDETPVLTPFVPVTESVKKYVTKSRVGLVLLCLVISTTGVALIPDHEFRSVVSVDSIADLNACQRYCAQARDGKFTVSAWPRGATPLCEEEDGTSTVVYQECYGHKYTDCHQVDKKRRHPPDEIVRTKCQFPIVPLVWMPYATVSVFAVAILLVIQGFEPGVLLIGAAAILAVLGVVTPREVIAGLANSGVISLAVLFPISEAITETGMLEIIVGAMLGEPNTVRSALLRMMLLVAAVSAFLSNTATVSMMIPIVVSWSKRLNVHPGQMLMPLSFAAQLGGCMTLLGGSQCLVAKASIPDSVYSMEFFDLFPIGGCIMLGTAMIIALLAPTRLLQSSGEPTVVEVEQINTPSSAQADHHLVYTVKASVTNRKLGGLRGKKFDECGLQRLAGVLRVRHLAVREVLQPDDMLEVICDADGVVSLRQHPGITLEKSAELAKLGADRRCRSLYECSVRPDSPLLERPAGGSRARWEDPKQFREYLGACLVSVKGRQEESNPRAHVGSVLLLEADYRLMRNPNWPACFTICRPVDNSSPPRADLPIDYCRNMLTCLGMILLIGLVTADLVELHIGGMVFLLLLLFMHSLTVRQLFKAMKPQILSTIVGALALGMALQKVGVVPYIAKWMDELAQASDATTGLTVVIYLTAVFLSMFINNSATIAILAPMIVSITSQDPSKNLEPMVWVLVYGAGSCFMTPLGYQTNLMVMPDGQYTFKDFVLFGFVIQACHLILTVIFVHCYLSYFVEGS